MPYRRGYSKRKYAGRSTRTTKRSRYSRSARSVPSMRLCRVSKPEVKYIDNNNDMFFDNNPANNTSIAVFNNVAQGVSGFERIGRSVRAKRIEFQYMVQPYVLPALANRVRVAIVRDKHPDGNIPTFATIFASINGVGTITSDVESFINPDERERFQVIYSRLFSTASVDATGVILRENMSSTNLSGSFTYSPKCIVDYKGTTTSMADIQSNAFYVIAFCKDTTSASQMWALHYSTRFSYTE